MIRVILADDQELIRESLSFVLNAQADIDMAGIATNGREAIVWCGGRNRTWC